MKYFNPKRPLPYFKQWEASILNREIYGSTSTPLAYDKAQARKDAAMALEANVVKKVYAPATAQGAYERRRGKAAYGVALWSRKPGI